jgi:hypothetical protein
MLGANFVNSKEKKMIELILCHLIGDYVLQIDRIADTKGANMYHLFVHSR